MSQRRNTTSRLSRRHYGAATLMLAALAACSAERVSGPAPAVAAAEASLSTTSGGTALPPQSNDAAKRQTDAGLTAMAGTWRTTAADIESPTTRPLNLSCGVRSSSMASQRIGPNGGTLRFGRSELRIPSGALASEVTISATLTLGTGARVQFAPHGLKFAKAAELRVDWTGCTLPRADAPVNLYYTDSYGRITQVMPSASAKGSTRARMLTDHFSGFTVGWGRSTAY